ncbi:TPA: ATP synthase F0 subunit B [Candidatus Uhrbacteria bacterium]|uniref:ATP synthase subunit b n=2 Tax=Candidatus Uhriibacteriota TaxID=1752732 RepID=A0A0G1Q7K9_9BACT|nr:MAG: ATP synthase subunit b [Candidatus Uhrbacteria bacterium GW2011_GWF2_46_218]KKU40984.1 MAG: ATP synthase subunit b [Candidatus Uhrbacteria bacterium GW2011_GWE2_46_68]HBK33656.1 ATP synthase F0 subunit B [Candidatus Uhrbacteria bacterium]HCB18945.1 ATP synthase F0 subunit B [Candidatus Uhrbacteria bacterium]
MSQEVALIHEAAEAVETTGGLGTLGINVKIFLAQLVNFTIVLLVLWRWAYRPIVKLLEDRQKKVEKSLQDAADIEKRVVSLEEERKSILSQAKHEAHVVLEKVQTDAEVRRVELLAKAKEEVSQVVHQGKVQLQAEKEAMLRETRQEIVNLAIESARKILEESISEKKSQALAEEVIEKMS